LVRNHLQTCSAVKTAQLLRLHFLPPLWRFLHKSRFIVKISLIVWTRGIRAGFIGVIEGRLGLQPLANLFSCSNCTTFAFTLFYASPAISAQINFFVLKFVQNSDKPSLNYFFKLFLIIVYFVHNLGTLSFLLIRISVMCNNHWSRSLIAS
jgi:hypothetical protein